MEEPSSFDDDNAADWARRVIERGLPKLPKRIRRGESVPIARWVGTTYAAVLFASWMYESNNATAEDDYQSMDVIYFASSTEGWHEILSRTGGSLWPSSLSEPKAGSNIKVEIGELSTVREGQWHCGSISGIARGGPRWVRLSQEGEDITREVESEPGFFIVCVNPNAPGRVEVIDRNGHVLGQKDIS